MIHFSCPLFFTLKQAYCIIVTASNNKYCRHCIVPRGTRSFSPFFFYLSQHVLRMSALLGQLCARYVTHTFSVSLYRSCAIHLREHGGTSSSFHGYMPCEYTHAQDTRPEMNILLSKQENSFCSMSSFFSMPNHCFVGYSIQCTDSFFLSSFF